MRFLISFGETRTLLRDNESERCAAPVAVTGSKDPSPTTIDEGKGYRGLDKKESELGSKVI